MALPFLVQDTMGYHRSCIRKDGRAGVLSQGGCFGLLSSAPGHLDCGSLKALLLSLCYAQISFMPWAKLLPSQASTAACGAVVVQGSHSSSPAQDSSHNDLARSAACCLLYGLPWGWGWPLLLCFRCHMRRAELGCLIREDKTHGGQCASKDTHTHSRLPEAPSDRKEKQRGLLYPQSCAPLLLRKKKLFSLDFLAFHSLPCCSVALKNAVCKKDSPIASC